MSITSRLTMKIVAIGAPPRNGRQRSGRRLGDPTTTESRISNAEFRIAKDRQSSGSFSYGQPAPLGLEYRMTPRVVVLDGTGAVEIAVLDRLRLKAAMGKCAPGQRVLLPGTSSWPITLASEMRHLD